VRNDLRQSFEARYPFPLDPFQRDAIDAIADDKSVIVSAPTGSGKTLVAEFAIHAALARRRRIAYTTPLKALSNQKYADFCRQFGDEHVGILTGDVKVNARAPVLVMTTEILRNMFYTGGLEGLEFVVLDECHYMGDEGRGTVWEEIIVNAPKDVALVALSATVRNIGEIADWISIVHRPIVPITHPHRSVPLQYLVADLSGEIHTYDAVRRGKVRLLGQEREGGYNDKGRWYTRRVVDPTVMLDELESRGWLPAIYFAPLPPRAAGGGCGHPRGGQRQPHHPGVAAQPDHLPGSRHGGGPASRGGAALGEAPHRAALRARSLQGGLRHGDHVAGHPHARQERGPPVAD